VKALILAFFYANVLCVLDFTVAFAAVLCVTEDWKMASGIVFCTTVMNAVSLVCWAPLLWRDSRDFSAYDILTRRPGRSIDWKTKFGAFGEKWWQRFIPIQSGCTSLAWPGIDWDDPG
jgi:uncharacterized membrane protein